ncbi:MAG: hypothetical protein A3K83_03805 [Omnitrophica WOR_2 bacterium RBG_13_44_8b]|nr:MAG: hypothetical protein A3K83_03805 [Omnitrophica WOR_2 bacterium RBG_13_44_8b]
MNKIKPFRAILYNKHKIKDLSRVVCPPYDIISEADQEYYHELSPYNLIHILLGKETPGEDKYRKAARYFKDWLLEGVLTPDDAPAIYFYSQQYYLKGEKRTRLGFISLLKLDDNNAAVFGHEHTRLAPKEDRLKLIKQVKANLSPIFVICQDHKRIIQRVYQKNIQDKEPIIDIIDRDKVAHKLWRLDSPALLADIESSMSKENMFIADGHHRYEVACAFRDEMKGKLGAGSTGEEDFNYILSYFTNTDSRGLSILPVHRLLKLDSQFDLPDFILKLKDYFDVEEIKDKSKFFFLMEKGGRAEHVLGIYKDKKFWLLRLKNIKILDKEIRDKPDAYKSLDVSILNHIVLNEILGKGVGDSVGLTYSPNAEEFMGRVDSDGSFIAFFLNPVNVQHIITVALSKERMPPKSTYFYPKVLSGLVMNKFEI